MNSGKTHISKHTKYTFSNFHIEQLCINQGELVTLKKGEILFDEHSKEPTRFVYYLAEGVCAISGISSSGREQVFLYQTAGELLGHLPHLLSQDMHYHPYAYRRPTILTKTKCVFYKIPSEAFVEYLHRYPDISLYVNSLLAHRCSRTLARLKQMQEDSVVSSICRLLFQVSSPTEEGLLVPKLFTYGEIAKFLGVHEVTVSRVMGRLKQLSFIEKVPSGLLIKEEEELQHIIQNPDTFTYK